MYEFTRINHDEFIIHHSDGTQIAKATSEDNARLVTDSLNLACSPQFFSEEALNFIRDRIEENKHVEEDQE